ncbi:hypothetical protein GCM10020001_073890 [Nonomuraea salmonea]
MDLYEYQAKELFGRHGIPVPAGRVAATPAEARAIAAELDTPVVIKAQVKTGGRGKAGGIRPAAGPAAAQAEAERVIGMDIKGHTAHRVLVEAATVPFEEYYAAFLVDRAEGAFLAMVSAQGGMEIEELAARDPDAIVKLPIDPATGVDADTARQLAAKAGLPEATAEVLEQLWHVLVAEDALLVEVNPLICTTDQRIMALDGKVTLDDNAAFRHDRERYAEQSDSLEARARAKGLNYVKLDGTVGVIGNGAGLVMSTLDVVAGAGADPANFLDIGGGAPPRSWPTDWRSSWPTPTYGRCWSTSSAASRPATRWPTASSPHSNSSASAARAGPSSYGWTATTPRWAGASSATPGTRRSARSPPWTAPPRWRPDSRQVRKWRSFSPRTAGCSCRA